MSGKSMSCSVSPVQTCITGSPAVRQGMASHRTSTWPAGGRAMVHPLRDLQSFVIRFDFESYVRFEIRFVVMVRFEIFESSALSIVIRKETIGGG